MTPFVREVLGEQRADGVYDFRLKCDRRLAAKLPSFYYGTKVVDTIDALKL
jgi:hypothetical protein